MAAVKKNRGSRGEEKKKSAKKAAPKKAAPKVVKKAAPAATAKRGLRGETAQGSRGEEEKKTVKKAAPKKAAAQITAGATGKADSVSVRMYAHGFGDCFLLTFLSKEQPIYRMLIDCGMLTGDTDRLRQVIDHIKTECGGKLDLVVQTHEHKDHISGFNLRDKNKTLLWDAIEVDRVWLAWTENTGSNGDDLAIQLKQKQDKKKKALAKALQLYNTSIQQAEHRTMMNKEYQGSDYYAAQQRYATALQQILGFFDISAEDVAGMAADGTELGLTMKDAMGYFVNRSRTNGSPDITFWDPGEQADAKTTGLPGINFYFLGPPKDYDKLRVMEDSQHIEMYLTEMGLSDNFFVALTSEEDEESNEALSPFHKRYRWQGLAKEQSTDPEDIWNLYYNKDHDWRSIENDWLHNAGALALNLDSYTNNTSLVIAIELEDSDKVLLFPADAQIGNWLSWTEAVDAKNPEPRLKWQVTKKGKQETITAENLLKRTVFYKVGHHASHNATARKHGLELMTSGDLVAMIPVDEAVAKKQGKKGWKMPAEDLYKRLQEKTKSRIIRLDKGSILANGAKDLPEGAKPNKQQLDDFNSCVSESDILITTEEGIKRPLFWEYVIKG